MAPPASGSSLLAQGCEGAPLSLRAEMWELGSLGVGTIAAVMIGARLVHANIVQIIIGKCGGKPEQAAAGLAIATYVPFTVFGSAVQVSVGTLTAQALGARNISRAGEWLFTGLAAVPLVGASCCIVCIVVTPVLVTLSTEDADVRSLAPKFTPIFVWSALLFQLFGMARAWFQAQKVVAPFVCAASFGVVCNASIGYLLACEPGSVGWTGAAIGIVGGGVGQILASLTWAVISKGKHQAVWAGARFRSAFKRERVVELGKMVGYRGLWTTLDEGSCMVISLMTGRLGTAEVATQSVYFLLWALVYGMQMGVFSSVNTRVSLHLGAGNARNARTAAVSGIIAFGILTIVCDGVLFLAPLGRIFSKDVEVRALIEANLPALALCIAATSAQEATFAPLSNSAKELRRLTLIVAVSAWIVGLPVASFLAFGPADLGLLGVWLGVTCGETTKAIAAGWVLSKFDWADAAERTQHSSLTAGIGTESGGARISTGSSISMHSPEAAADAIGET